MVIKNAKAFINGAFREGTDIVVSEGTIAAIGQGLALWMYISTPSWDRIP